MPMPEAMLLKLVDHATGKTVWTPPAQWYLAYFNDGTEVTGGSYARQEIDFADAVALSSTHVRAGSSNGQVFDNLPTTDVDEARIVDTASGAYTDTLATFTYIESFTSGDTQGPLADATAIHMGDNVA